MDHVRGNLRLFFSSVLAGESLSSVVRRVRVGMFCLMEGGKKICTRISPHIQPEGVFCVQCDKIKCRECEKLPRLLCRVVVCLGCLIRTREQKLRALGTENVGGKMEKWNRYDRWVRTHSLRLKLAEKGKKDSTVAKYACLLKGYMRFCTKLGLPGLPAREEDVETYLLSKREGLEETKRGKIALLPASLDGIVYALKSWHEAFELVVGWKGLDPTAGRTVKIILQGLKKLYTPKLEERVGISERAMERILMGDPVSQRAMHQKFVAAVMFLGGLRVGEALNLRYSENPFRTDMILPDTEKDPKAHVTVLILRDTKTSARGEVIEKYILDGAAPGKFIFSSFARMYIRYVGMREGQQLLDWPEDVRGREVLSSRHVSQMAKQIVREAGEDERRISSHSFRRGNATWWLRQGMSLENIQEAGAWKSRAVERYAGSRRDRVIESLKQLLK